MRIERQRSRDAAAQRAGHDEVQGAEVRQFEPRDVALHEPGEVHPDPLRRHVFDDARVVARVEHDERDVADTPLATGASGLYIAERHETVTESTRYDTRFLGTSAVRIATT